MPLLTENLKELGLDNQIEIQRIMKDDRNLINLINNHTDIKSLYENSNDYLNFNLYKLKYYLYKNIYMFLDYLNDELDIIFNNNMSYYDIILNIFFLTLVVIIFIIMYWDSVYRNAKKNSRCTITDNIINENNSLSSPYIYNIYIVDNNYESSFDTNYIIYLKYDFTKNRTELKDGLDKEYNKKYNTIDDNKYFKYYDLEINGNKYININKDLLKNKTSYIITEEKNNIINSEFANNLKNFIKDYNYKTNIDLNPIFDIKQAYIKNISSDY